MCLVMRLMQFTTTLSTEKSRGRVSRNTSQIYSTSSLKTSGRGQTNWLSIKTASTRKSEIRYIPFIDKFIQSHRLLLGPLWGRGPYFLKLRPPSASLTEVRLQRGKCPGTLSGIDCTILHRAIRTHTLWPIFFSLPTPDPRARSKIKYRSTRRTMPAWNRASSYLRSPPKSVCSPFCHS